MNVRWGRLGLAVAAVVGLVVGFLHLTTDDEPTQPTHPEAWEQRLLPLVKIVERERRLKFKHPVFVDFLTPKEFEKQVTADEADLTDEDREEIRQAEGMMRALGLLGHDTDLFDAVNQASGGATVGYYQYDDQRIRVRGKALTPTVRSTLVHELTHALQDQHFDLGKRSEALEKAEDSSATATWDAIVEGDASRVETLYRDGLNQKQKRRLQADEERQLDRTAEATKDVPEFLSTIMGFPYVLGEALLELAVELDGTDAVDDLFEDPPVTEEHLLDPWTLLVNKEDARDVPTPKLADNEEELDADTFGSPSLLFVLAERVPPKVALTAADGWAGDRYVSYRRGETTCLRIDWYGDTKEDQRELHAAFKTWIKNGPAGAAKVTVNGDKLTFDACEPKQPTKVAGRTGAALSLVLNRIWAAAGALDQGADRDLARCFGHEIVMRFTSSELTSESFGRSQDTANRLAQIVADCR